MDNRIYYITMIKKILYRLASGVLFMIIALFLCAASGLGVFFPIKLVGIIGFIIGFLFPSLLSED